QPVAVKVAGVLWLGLDHRVLVPLPVFPIDGGQLWAMAPFIMEASALGKMMLRQPVFIIVGEGILQLDGGARPVVAVGPIAMTGDATLRDAPLGVVVPGFGFVRMLDVGQPVAMPAQSSGGAVRAVAFVHGHRTVLGIVLTSSPA